MSWCDKLASVPTVGVRLSPSLIPADFMLRALAPVVLEFVGGDISLFSMEEHTSFGFKFGTQDGFKFGVDMRKMHVGFQHQMKAIPVSGGPPVMQMLSTPRPYTELLPQVTERLEKMVVALPDTNSRSLERIGIVSLTHVDEQDLPPGIARYISYQRKPWSEPLDHYVLKVSVAVAQTEKWIDRCIHTITKPEDPNALMTIQLDWGREYKEQKKVLAGSLHSDLNHCMDSALKYFEEMAEGQRFDV